MQISFRTVCANEALCDATPDDHIIAAYQGRFISLTISPKRIIFSIDFQIFPVFKDIQASTLKIQTLTTALRFGYKDKKDRPDK